MVCLTFDELVGDSQPEIARFTTLQRQYPDGGDADACNAFNNQVQTVEGFLRILFRYATKSAGRLDEVDEIVQIWAKMGSVCDEALSVLKDLHGNYPYCGTDELYNFALDMKIACQERSQIVEDERLCEGVEFPAGMFPEGC